MSGKGRGQRRRDVLRTVCVAFLCLCPLLTSWAQEPYDDGFNQVDADGNIRRRNNGADTLGTSHEFPRGIYVWTVDRRFGDIRPADVDTLPVLFYKHQLTAGRTEEYNTTGNQGAPRLSRLFMNRQQEQQFIFTNPYDYFIVQPEKFHFTNTLSPITNLTYGNCGSKTNGEDHFKALFAVNAGKRLGMGFKFDYLYARGYYSSQSTSHFNFTTYGSYLGDRYDMHLLFSVNEHKVTENGGITDDTYITHPENSSQSFTTDEIPTVLGNNWNRNHNTHLFLTHRYKVGFKRKVPMTEQEIKARKFAIEAKKDQENREKDEKAERGETNEPKFAGRPDDAKIAGNAKDLAAKEHEQKGRERIRVDGEQARDSLLAASDRLKTDSASLWLKDEFLPVTSFVHTLEWNSYERIYQAYQSPKNYYANKFFETYDIGFPGDSLYDKTRHHNIRNTLAIAMLEGFNKWAKAGLKVFAAHEFRHFTLPDASKGVNSYNENNISIGGQLIKTQGSLLHYDATAEFVMAGEDAGQFSLEANADLNVRMLGDTVMLKAHGFLRHLNPSFYYRNYHSKHFWWENNLDKEIRTRIEGELWLRKTKTKLRASFEELKNYTYFGQTYQIDGTTLSRTANDVRVRQCGSPITVLALALEQKFRLGPLHWDSEVTYQKSTNSAVLPLPALNVYTNLHLDFTIARVLDCQLGADMTYFTKYTAPDYCPMIGQFCIQENEDSQRKIGNYPFVNVYANFFLKHARFFVMMSHVNAGMRNKAYFVSPHYPANGSVLRLGVSWNFFN